MRSIRAKVHRRHIGFELFGLALDGVVEVVEHGADEWDVVEERKQPD